MKKVFGLAMLMLITALLIFGCSGGGGSSAENPASPSNGGTGGGDGNNPTASGGGDSTEGYLVINFTDGQAHLRAASSTTLPTADHVRVVVRKIGTVSAYTNEDGDEFGPVSTTTYKQIADVSTSGTLTITLPPSTGYTVDILSYAAGTPNLVLKWAQQSNVTITSGGTTNIGMVLAPIDATISAPGSVASGSIYSVSISNLAFPLRSDKKNLKVSSSPITTLGTYASADDSFQRTAPVIGVSGSAVLYFQGLFFVDGELLNAADIFSNWVYGYPISAWGDSSQSGSVTPPGQISITVTL